MSIDQEKLDNEVYSRNFTRVPNIVFVSYKHLSHEEKHLYNNLKCIYWDAKPRFSSLRDIARVTGYVISALSRMLPRLHKCGLIHAEIKQEYNSDGSKKGKPRYHITIPDIWELNRRYFECSPEERFDPSEVLLENENVPLKNVNVPDENVNVPDENVNVLLEVRKRSSQEQQIAPRTRPQARLQPAKDSIKDSIKDSKKEGAPSVPPIGTDSPSNPSFTQPSSQEKDPEEERIAGYLEELDFDFDLTEANGAHLRKIARKVRSLEDMASLKDFTQNQEHLKGKQIYLANMAKTNILSGWKQKQMPPESEQVAPKLNRPKTLQEMDGLEKAKYYEQKYAKKPAPAIAEERKQS